jgi:thermitase
MSAAVAAGAVNNNYGAAGVCPDCTILPVMVFPPGEITTDMSTVAAGIYWAADNGADIISMSLAGPETTPTLTAAVDYAIAKGAVVVAAAANQGEVVDCSAPLANPCATTPMYPAFINGVISVAAANPSRNFYSWSSRWAGVKVSAPGCNITVNHAEELVFYCGTSSATPVVADAPRRLTMAGDQERASEVSTR